MARKSTRGRPKGSGIDDEKLLKKITNLLAKDPGLKPTSAIKAVGIDDPSAIRRLRDKLKSAGPKTRIAGKAATKKPATKRKAAAKKAPRKKVVTRKSATASQAAKKSTAKKAAVKKTVTTRTADSGRAAPKTSAPKKTVKTRRAPGKEAPDASPSMGASMFANPFAELGNGSTFAQQMPQMPDMNMESIISSTVEKQIQFYESAVKFSPIAHMLRQQAMITDMMLTMLRTQKEINKPPRDK